MDIQPFLLKRVTCIAVFTGLLAACSTSPEEPAKPMTADVSESVVAEEGVPGGVATRTARIDATVKSIDYDTRTVTLRDDEGGEQTVTIGPEAVNFDQVQKGDWVTVVYTEETVVYLKALDDAAEDGAEAVAGRAEAGNKPEGFAAGTAKVTAIVTGVDLATHSATLQFPDGSSREVRVRDDVELSEDQVGRQVVIQTTAAVALSVEKAE